MNYLKLLRGDYPASPTHLKADVIVGNSFGTATHEGSVNYALARYIDAHAEGRPVVADTMLAQLLECDIAHEVVGPISDNTGGGVGTWGIEVAAHNFMREHNLQVALQVAQAYHMGRVAAQAVASGIIYNTFPDRSDMPDWFDKNSGQIWTRNRGLWIMREAVGIPVLHAQDKL